MKQLFKTSTAALMIALMFISTAFTAKADDCSKAVDDICNGYDAVTERLKSSTDLQQVISVDFTQDLVAATNQAGESCYAYELTSEDKDKLKKSVETVVYTLVDKADEFTGGAAHAQLEAGIKPLIEDFHRILSESKTLGDYVAKMNE